MTFFSGLIRNHDFIAKKELVVSSETLRLRLLIYVSQVAKLFSWRHISYVTSFCYCKVWKACENSNNLMQTRNRNFKQKSKKCSEFLLIVNTSKGIIGLSKKLVFDPAGPRSSKLWALKVCPGRGSNPGRSESSDSLHKIAFKM